MISITNAIRKFIIARIANFLIQKEKIAVASQKNIKITHSNQTIGQTKS